jgi:hypothetical protein
MKSETEFSKEQLYLRSLGMDSFKLISERQNKWEEKRNAAA